MAAGVVVGGGVPVRRVVTAADVTAFEADPQVQPHPAFSQAVLASRHAVREIQDRDRVEVSAGRHV
jgi:hypothetical protein